MSEKVNMDFPVACFMTDASFRMKPSSFMELSQEMAMNGATMLGFGYDELGPHNMTWVLSRMHIKFVDTPVWRQNVRMRTWHKGVHSLFYLRDFDVTDAEGKLLALATSSWVVINTEARSLVRFDTIGDLVDPTPQSTDNAIEEPCPKVCIPRKVEPEEVCKHVVAYSDVDFIGHTNNTKYIVWAMDCIPEEITFNRPVKDVYVNFNKEARRGETVTLMRHVAEEECGLCFYIDGFVDGHNSFTSKIVF